MKVSKVEADNRCSVDSADTEGDVAGDGLRPGRLCVSAGMGPRGDDHHPTAGPPRHGRLRKSAGLSSKVSHLSGPSSSLGNFISAYRLGSAPVGKPML